MFICQNDRRAWRTVSGLCGVMLLALSACTWASSPVNPNDTQKLKVVATTTLLGDVTRQIGGEAIELAILLPAGADPHTFEPTPRDFTAIANADVLIVNGAGLETFLERLLQNAGKDAKVVTASDGIRLRQSEDEHADTDPHVWFDPQNVVIWTQNIERALSELDPANAAAYAANAEAYRDQLRELDDWIQTQIAQIPQTHRKLVTDHAILGYFAERYGFEQVGAVMPGFSVVAEPSAQDLAELENTVRELEIPAIFVGTTVNPNLAQRVAEDTGVRLVSLYTDALTAPGGEADSYLALMRYDVAAIVAACKTR